MNDSMNVAGNPINQPQGDAPRTRSKFNLSYHLYNTERFGEYNSNFVFDGVEGDKVPIRSGGSVQSYTLRAPLMQSISKKKDYYQVPMMAILPFNWDKWYTNPTIGDDVPDDCGTGVENFWTKIGPFIDAWRGYVVTAAGNNENLLNLTNALFRFLVLGEYFYSNGSLMTSLGCHGSRFLRIVHKTNAVKETWSYDRWFDKVCEVFKTICPYFQFTDSDGYVKYVVNQPSTDGDLFASYPCVTLHDFLQYMRDDLNTYVSQIPASYTKANFDSNIVPFFKSSANDDFRWIFTNVEQNYDLRRLWAYQLVCAHFYSNDHVDYIYSAELYRQLIGYYTLQVVPENSRYFTVNGLKYRYDFMCANYFSTILYQADYARHPAMLYSHGNPIHIDSMMRGYLSALFSYRRSLRFVDYFTGSRTRPLAVGDVNVDVQTGSPNYVNVIDVTRNIQRQRFFNAVNRFGRKIEEYAKGLTGVSMAPDYHNPLYIAHTNDTVYGTQIENTGADQLTKQQTVTSRLVSNGSRYQFEFTLDRPSVVIGITYYDIRRAYLYSCERQLMHLNRFDMFNPFMQFIGDQAVYFGELGAKRDLLYNGNFGYQLRHMEYKQRFDQAAGGFVENLPGYIFDNEEDDSRANTGSLSTDYIRSLNSELDKFYVSLTGYSLGSYFHFIVDNDNYSEASRPMAYAPSIL